MGGQNSCAEFQNTPTHASVRYLEILGEENSLDAYHNFTAEKHGLDAFLHFDLKLDRQLKQHGIRREPLRHRTRPLLP
jgi:hypothetical protein